MEANMDFPPSSSDHTLVISYSGELCNKYNIVKF